jgi:hypothetical protein
MKLLVERRGLKFGGSLSREEDIVLGCGGLRASLDVSAMADVSARATCDGTALI